MVSSSRFVAAIVLGAAVAPAALAAEDNAELLPPLVEFVGKSPKLKVYPGGTKDKEATWYMLEFGAVEEVDSSGKAVSDRSIKSLAAEKDMTWTQKSEVVGGAGTTSTRMELYLNKTFDKACKGGQGRMPNETSVISVETFVFSGPATIKYGNETLEVLASSLKYNVRSTNWPFCEQGNKLQVNMDVKVKGDKKANMKDKDMAEEERNAKAGKGGKGVKGKKFRANAGNMDLDMDLPTLSVVDGLLVDSEVELEEKGGKTEVLFKFPHFKDTLLYDPTAGFSDPAATAADHAVACGAPVAILPLAMLVMTVALP